MAKIEPMDIEPMEDKKERRSFSCPDCEESRRLTFNCFDKGEENGGAEDIEPLEWLLSFECRACGLRFKADSKGEIKKREGCIRPDLNEIRVSA